MNTNNVPNQETINNLLLDVVRGVKVVGSDMYDVSKAGLVKALEITQEQTPLLMKEFLAWKLTENVLQLVSVLIVAVIFSFFVKKLYDFTNRQRDAYIPEIAIMWALVIAGYIIMSIFSFTRSVEITKLLVAPKIYLIEYCSKILLSK